jgi:alkylation response protein AidB-like acyl-CoA dehydrogenase
MDFDLTEEQRAIKETARAFARGAMLPFARQWDEDEIFPVDTLREAAALGLGGIYVAADVGGSALSRCGNAFFPISAAWRSSAAIA